MTCEEVRQQLRSACRQNDLSQVRQLFSTTSLGAADAAQVLTNALPHLELTRYLLEQGADPNSDIRLSPLHSFMLVKLLVEFGYDIASTGHLLLHYFADDAEALDWLIDHGVDVTRTDHECDDRGKKLAGRGMSTGNRDYSLKVLNNIAARGDTELFDHIVSRGADPLRSLALHRASKFKDAEKSTKMIEHLLDKHHMNLEAHTNELRSYIHFPGDTGTPLVCAVYYNNLAAVQCLLKRGATPHSALVLAIGRPSAPGGFLPAVSLLLDAGTDVDGALEQAVDMKNFEAVKVCVAKGAHAAPMLSRLRARAARKARGLSPALSDEEDCGAYHSSGDDDEDAEARSQILNFLSAASDSVVSKK